MRTTITLDDDVVALIDSERQRTGASFRDAVNSLLRRSARGSRSPERPTLPTWPGRPLIDITDVSAVIAELDEEERPLR